MVFNCLNIAAAGPVLLNQVHVLNTISNCIFNQKFAFQWKIHAKVTSVLKNLRARRMIRDMETYRPISRSSARFYPKLFRR